MNAEKRRKKRLRNLVCIVYCSLQLLIVLALFQGMGSLLHKLVPAGIDLSQIEGKIVAVDDEQENKDKLDENKLIVCLDAGHGGKDNGSDYRLRYEKNDNLKITQAVAAYLADKENIQVIMTRSDDTFLSLEERTSFANQNNADYFVSLHRNTGEGNGVETWIRSDADDKTQALAKNIMDNLDAAGISRNRGVKKGTQKSESKDYYVNLHTNMPACIVELGFMNSPTDNQLFDANVENYAKAIGDAVLKTYEAYGKDGADATESVEDVPGTEEQISTETGEGTTGQVLQNTQIENVSSLDATSHDWGLGSHTDDENRPLDAVNAHNRFP